MKFAKLHSFDVFQKVENEEESPKKRTFIIRKPNRKMYEDNELFYGKEYNQAILVHHLIPQALLAKTFAQYDGIYTEEEKKNYISVIQEVRELESEYQTIILKPSESRSKKDESRIEEIQNRIIECRATIRDYEIQEDDSYKHTAESYANRKRTFWWVVNLGYESINDKDDNIILSGDSYEEKLDFYEKLVQDDDEKEFWNEVFNKLTFYVAIWTNPSVFGSDEETFQNIIQTLERGVPEENKDTPKGKKRSTKKDVKTDAPV